jgi:hypothetical protein
MEFDSQSPLLRTQRVLQKAFRENKAGRASAIALCSGEKLTRHQKKAFFRMAHNAGCAPNNAAAILGMSSGRGVSADELEALHVSATKAKVPAKTAHGFENYVAEVAGPGSMSVILEVRPLQLSAPTCAWCARTQNMQTVGRLTHS